MKIKIHIYIIFAFAIILGDLSCKKFIEIDAPKTSLVQETVFKNDDIATSAVTGIYNRMSASGYASGAYNGISSVCGLSADELISFNGTLNEFYQNQISASNSIVYQSFWQVPYSNIYTANSVLEGLVSPNGVSPLVKKQLQGEALFIRAFSYFYLVNLFGPVPLITSSDYQENAKASRTPVTVVYQQIITDLKTAEDLLPETYITTERIRPNKSAVQSLLARTYLYLQDWANAERYSSTVIGKSSTYSLVNIDAIFIKNSSETIWQLMPLPLNNSQEGNLFILQATPSYVALNNDFALNAFESGDNRKTSWVKNYTNSTGTYYYPNKYKIKSSTTVTEYSMVMRLAEQYLIRAEARAQQNNLLNAIDDVDAIRSRAGLPLIKNSAPGITKVNLLLSIQQERRVEFFAEWGHRWLDLKRNNLADMTLSPIKSQWQKSDIFYPIPQGEINADQNIKQNEGY